jgi:hypothetical protein
MNLEIKNIIKTPEYFFMEQIEAKYNKENYSPKMNNQKWKKVLGKELSLIKNMMHHSSKYLELVVKLLVEYLETEKRNLSWKNIQRTFFGGKLDKVNPSGTMGILKLLDENEKYFIINISPNGFMVAQEHILQELEFDDRECSKIMIFSDNGVEELKLEEFFDYVDDDQLEELETVTDTDENSDGKILGYVVSGSTPERIRIQLKSDEINAPVYGAYGVIQVANQKALLAVKEVTLHGETDIIENYDEKAFQVHDTKIMDGYIIAVKPGKSLWNVPNSAQKVYYLGENGLADFYEQMSQKIPIEFMRSIDMGTNISLDLMKLKQHGMIIAKTGAGKGGFANALLSTAVGKKFIADDEKKYSTGVLYIDANGQWNRRGGKYGYFKPEGPFDEPNFIKLENTEEVLFIDLLLKKLNFNYLNFSSEKKKSFLHLLDKNFEDEWDYQDFISEAKTIIGKIYADKVEEKIELFNDYVKDCNLENIWNEIKEKYNLILENYVDPQNIFEKLINGEMVVVDTSSVDTNMDNAKVCLLIHNMLKNLIEKTDKLWRERGMADYCVPFITAIDEIHRFCPNIGKNTEDTTPQLTSLKRYLIKWTAEFRKYGAMLLGITQTPKQASHQLFGNIGLKIIGSMAEKRDRDFIKEVWQLEAPRLRDLEFVVYNGKISNFGGKLMKVRALKSNEIGRNIN